MMDDAVITMIHPTAVRRSYSRTSVSWSEMWMWHKSHWGSMWPSWIGGDRVSRFGRFKGSNATGPI